MKNLTPLCLDSSRRCHRLQSSVLILNHFERARSCILHQKQGPASRQQETKGSSINDVASFFLTFTPIFLPLSPSPMSTLFHLYLAFFLTPPSLKICDVISGWPLKQNSSGRGIELQLSAGLTFILLSSSSLQQQGEKSPLICQCPHQTRATRKKNLKTDQLLGNSVSWFVGYDWSAILQTDKQEE